MQTLIALLVAAAAACAIARPSGPTAAASASLLGPSPQRMPPPLPPPQEFLGDYLLPRMLLPRYMGYVESPVIAPRLSGSDWLSKEINHINQMGEDEDSINPERDILRWYSDTIYLQNMLESPVEIQEPIYAPDTMQDINDDIKPMAAIAPRPLLRMSKQKPEIKRDKYHSISNPSDDRKQFALTPIDEGYYEPIMDQQQLCDGGSEEQPGENVEPRAAMVLEPPRQIRQNPNLSKQKHLLEPDLGKLKAGLSHEEGGMGVMGGAGAGGGVAGTQQQVDPAESMFGVALLAAVGAALAMAVVGVGFGWYTLSKRAKAAADVDYPAYGVTGPSLDTSGDRKLAHSAHMYHYQHQKQQIIAMERNGLEQRANSVSDPESEEENEEGDYTVYECPGFATTGDMEVKNPLFSEDPTPVTPGKCEVVKQQPKD